tara:strand:- start:1058 stop:1426 length:369 start_codon:yes stop_codon:yes gene_type:complete
MTDPKLFKLTNKDKLHYRKLIKNIDPDHERLIVELLRKKIQNILDTGNLNSVEVELIKDIEKLNYILLRKHDLSAHVVKKILFAMSYVVDEDDEIPDFIPKYGYLDDISVVEWVINDIKKDI